jgi:hypothetical protein
MKNMMLLWTKAILAFLLICLGGIVAASDLAPMTPISVVLTYMLWGTISLVTAIVAFMWLKFLVNQFLLNAGATDTQWLWFNSEPKSLAALRRRNRTRPSTDD